MPLRVLHPIQIQTVGKELVAGGCSHQCRGPSGCLDFVQSRTDRAHKGRIPAVFAGLPGHGKNVALTIQIYHSSPQVLSNGSAQCGEVCSRAQLPRLVAPWLTARQGPAFKAHLGPFQRFKCWLKSLAQTTGVGCMSRSEHPLQQLPTEHSDVSLLEGLATT